MKYAIAVVALGLVLGGCTAEAPVTITKTVSVTTEAAPPKSQLPTLSYIYAACKLDPERGAKLGDGDKTLSLELFAYPIDTLTLTVDEAVCVSLELKMPSSVSAKLAATENGDPSQTESWENVTLTWKISDLGNISFIYEMAA